MTSANVIEYDIMNKEGEVVGHHRQHIMCKTNTKELIEKFIPASEYTILPYGYDEEEEIWYGTEVPLDIWLSKNPNELK